MILLARTRGLIAGVERATLPHHCPVPNQAGTLQNLCAPHAPAQLLLLLLLRAPNPSCCPLQLPAHAHAPGVALAVVVADGAALGLVCHAHIIALCQVAALEVVPAWRERQDGPDGVGMCAVHDNSCRPKLNRSCEQNDHAGNLPKLTQVHY